MSEASVNPTGIAVATKPDPPGHCHADASWPRPVLKGWSHSIAAIAAITLCPIVITLSPSGTRAVTSIYAGSVVALFTISATYHTVRWTPKIHRFWKSLDHCMIFVLIAATYTPIAATALPAALANRVLATVWVAAACGILLKVAWPDAPRALSVVLYVAMGWVALAVIGDLWRSVGTAGSTLLLAGGILHTVGGVVYARRRPDPWPRIFGFHEVFHAFVIAGVACHYVTIAIFALG